jgi:hypothetical protein
MKKSTIKRRKRVMPASGHIPSEVVGNSNTQQDTSSPEPPYVAPALPVHLERRPPQPRKVRRKSTPTGEEQLRTQDDEPVRTALTRPPPTIDFTGFRPSSPLTFNGHVDGRKRPLSSDSSEQLTHRQNNDGDVPRAVVDEMQLDPSLRQSTATEQTETDRESYKAERRLQLQREIEGMQKDIEGIQEAQRTKERELASLL